MRDWINESVYRRLAFALVAVLSLSAGVGLVIAAVWNPDVGRSVGLMTIMLVGIPVGLMAFAGAGHGPLDDEAT